MKCGRTDCDQDATHYPRVKIPAMGHARDTHPPLTSIIPLGCCLAHAKEFSFKDSPEIKSNLTGALPSMHYADPDFDRASTDAVEINSVAVQQFGKPFGGKYFNQSKGD